MTCALNIAYTAWQKNSKSIVPFADIMCTYQDNWTPVVGEQLICEWEERNQRNRYAERPLRKVGIQ